MASARANRSKAAKVARAVGGELGSGNVFADLGLPDADMLFAKGLLALQVRQTVGDKGLTQVAAARVLGMHQSDVSKLMRGYLDGFSTDRLFRMLNALGQDVDIVVRAKRMRRGHTRILDEYPAPRAGLKPARKKRPAR
jgi:predicted XRE-type DNA-binding protein